MVPGIIVLIGKIAFLAALYGFLYVVYRGLLAEARRGGRPRAVRPEGAPMVEQWELRPAAATAPLLRPPPPAAEMAPPQEEPAPATPPALLSAPAPDEPAPDEPAPDEPADDEPADDEPADDEPADDEPARTLEIPTPAEPGPTPEGTEAPQPEPPQEPEPEPEPPRPVAALVILTSPEAGLDSGARFELGEAFTLGRAPHNDVVLQDRFVSAHHAEIERRDESYVLRDMGSTNGTFRNGARIEADVVLQDGDRIGVGTSVFAFRVGG